MRIYSIEKSDSYNYITTIAILEGRCKTVSLPAKNMAEIHILT